MNAALLLRTIAEHDGLTRADLARVTGLSKPTVNEVVETLLASGYVHELPDDHDGAAKRRPGRPGRRISFRADLAHVVGVDVGANKILALVADLNGTVLASERRRTRAVHDAADLLDEVRAVIAAVLEAAGPMTGALAAVGVATPGVVDPTTGRISLAPQLTGWEGTSLAAALAPHFACPVLVDNEVHLSLLAERWKGAAQDAEHAFLLQIGMGIGGGTLIAGELYRGAQGAAGEVGYLPAPDGDDAPTDGLGPFEHAAGGGAFARLGRRAAATSAGGKLLELAGGDPEEIDAEVVFAAARLADPAAMEIVEEIVGRLAAGIASVAVVINPAVVIVGGGVSRAGADLLEPLERHVRRLAPIPPPLVLSTLGDEAAAIGAVRLAVLHAEERLYALELAEPFAVID
jgi:predicted NBD/HSP70 family sugar kinase